MIINNIRIELKHFLWWIPIGIYAALLNMIIPLMGSGALALLALYCVVIGFGASCLGRIQRKTVLQAIAVPLVTPVAAFLVILVIIFCQIDTPFGLEGVIGIGFGFALGVLPMNRFASARPGWASPGWIIRLCAKAGRCMLSVISVILIARSLGYEKTRGGDFQWVAYNLDMDEEPLKFLLFTMTLLVLLAFYDFAYHQFIYSSLKSSAPSCVHCGYNLTGNTSGVCPECGTPKELV